MSTFTHLTAFSFIATMYVAAGISLLAYLDFVRVGARRWPLPVIRVRWDRHGFIDVIIGFSYAAGDHLIRIGLLTH